MEKHPLDLKYPDLQKPKDETGKKSVVQIAVERSEQRTDETVPNDPNERIEAYLDRLEKLILDPKTEQKKKDLGDIMHTNRPRALSLLREKIINEYIRPNKEKMAEGAAIVEERAARQMGINTQYGEDQLAQRAEIAVGDLESSLDQWITYLSDKNEPYPVWFRYYAFRNILNLGEYDKDKKEFPKRSKGTFKLFPDVDSGALAYVQEMMEASTDDEVLNRIRQSQKTLWQTPDSDLLTKEKAKAFFTMPFAKQYAEGVSKNGEITPELRAETRGEWVKYQQGTDPTALWLSLQNKGTAWCTKGYPTAKTQLNDGDFYVYYTLDSQGKPTIPRIAIRMEGKDKIGENPRGVFDTQQNLEPNMIEIMEAKLKEFGSEADKYKKKSADMKRLTEIEKKITSAQLLSKEELTFLYELNSPIEGFGRSQDPRITEIRSKRNVKEDLPILFDCTPSQIATASNEATDQTLAYIGPWNIETYNKIQNYPNIKYLYSKFPESPILMRTIETDPTLKTPADAKNTILADGHQISSTAEQMLEQTTFSTESVEYNLVSFSVAELGFPNGATVKEIFDKGIELGLELCPAEVGPNLRLQYNDQPNDNYLFLAMETIDVDGNPLVWLVDRSSGVSWLYYFWARPDRRWDAGYRVVFVSRKS
ncbi:MAG TPA: hypothetical protein PKA60_02895 [Candidatus Paceibacterota bacterium]|nr:hypothetical protein [Candidatus Paceibacterota bacterium]